METKGISKAVIRRLPRYYRYLGELKADNIERISSNELSVLMNVTASQIRQDLNNFGGFGQQGYGYNVEYLYDEIAKILGLDRINRLIIIGVGNLGQAIANYANFQKRGFIVKALFDKNPNLIGKKIKGHVIRDSSELEEYLSAHRIDIATLTIPKEEAIPMAKRLVDCGVTAIWNFAHTDLAVPENVAVENVHLSESLMRLSYKVKNREAM